jgi:hypothetical protein
MTDGAGKAAPMQSAQLFITSLLNSPFTTQKPEI